MSYRVEQLLDSISNQVKPLAKTFDISLNIPDYSRYQLTVDNDFEPDQGFIVDCLSSAVQCAFPGSMIHISFNHANKIFSMDTTIKTTIDCNTLAPLVKQRILYKKPHHINANCASNSLQHMTLTISIPVIQ